MPGTANKTDIIPCFVETNIQCSDEETEALRGRGLAHGSYLISSRAEFEPRHLAQKPQSSLLAQDESLPCRVLSYPVCQMGVGRELLSCAYAEGSCLLPSASEKSKPCMGPSPLVAPSAWVIPVLVLSFEKRLCRNGPQTSSAHYSSASQPGPAPAPGRKAPSRQAFCQGGMRSLLFTFLTTAR